MSSRVKTRRNKAAVLSKPRKYKNYPLDAFTSLTTTWTVGDCASIANGTGISDRIARRVRPGVGHLRATLCGGQTNAITDDAYNTVRIVVVEASDTLVAGDWSSVTIDTPAVVGVWPKVRRFLFEKFVSISSYGLDSTGYIARIARLDYDFPIGGELEWDSTGGTDHAASTLYVACISDSGAVTNPGFVDPSFLWYDFSD